MPQSGGWRLTYIKPMHWVVGGGKLTNIVVYANESEHNPHQAPLLTRVGYMPENRNSVVAYVRTRTRTNVLPRVLPPAARKTASF